LSLPPQVGEAKCLRVTAHVARVLFKRFGSIHDSAEDFVQQVAVWTLQCAPRFDSAPGTFEASAYRNARDMAMNTLRDRVSRRDHPCERCHAGTPCGADGTHRKNYARWSARNKAKANLARPLGLSEVSDGCERGMHVDSMAESGAEGKELLDLIDRYLLLALRVDYLRLLAGEAVPKPRSERVREVFQDILDNPGHYNAQRSGAPVGEPDPADEDEDAPEEETTVSLYDELKARVTAAVRGGDTRTRDTLRTVLGEAQAEAVRRNGEVTDEVVLGVVRKAVTGLQETIPLAEKAGRDTAQQEDELALLESLLPRAWDREAIAAVLAPLRDELRAAKNDGQAMGVAMKALKAQGATTNPDDVKAVVAAARA
jgi:uncharacterized protein YqeY